MIQSRISARHGSTTAKRHHRQGLILITVMIVIAIISLAGYSFSALMFTERKAVTLQGDELKLGCVADSGAEYLQAYLSQSPELRHQIGTPFENPELFQGIVVASSELEAVDGDSGDGDSLAGRFSIVSPRIENGELTGLRFGVQDESARINLAALEYWESRNPGAAVNALLQLPGMTEIIAESILDWIDADSIQRSVGAESEHYAALDPGYSARNSVPTVIDELLLVKDVKRQLLFGIDTNRNHFLEESERGSVDDSDTLETGLGEAEGLNVSWERFLTLYSAERNMAPNGKQRVFLNNSDLTDLEQKLGEVLPAAWAKFIIAYRQHGPLKTSAIAVSTPDSLPLDLSKPAQFQFETLLDLVGANVYVPGTGGDGADLVIKSPIGGSPESMRDTLFQLLDNTTLIDSPYVTGRVNINRAAIEVLRAVPNVDSTMADRILAARTVQSETAWQERRHAIWLLTSGIVDLEQMKALMPFVNGGGDVFRAEIVSFYTDSQLSRRVEVVIDTSRSQPRKLYWRDLRLHGLVYPLSLLGGDREFLDATGNASLPQQ